MQTRSKSEEQTRAERKGQYEQVLPIIEHNTGGEQPALASLTSITQIARQTGINGGDVLDRLQAAKENGDILEWQGRVALATERGLKDVVGEENQAEYPRRQLIERCIDMLEEVDNGE